MFRQLPFRKQIYFTLTILKSFIKTEKKTFGTTLLVIYHQTQPIKDFFCVSFQLSHKTK